MLKFRRYLSCILTIAMVFIFVCVPAIAAEPQLLSSGNCSVVINTPTDFGANFQMIGTNSGDSPAKYYTGNKITISAKVTCNAYYRFKVQLIDASTNTEVAAISVDTNSGRQFVQNIQIFPERTYFFRVKEDSGYNSVWDNCLVTVAATSFFN